MLEARNGLGSSEFQNKAEVRMKRKLALHWRGEIITKKAHAGHGQETKWEMSIFY
jgi:hypothetical protein